MLSAVPVCSCAVLLRNVHTRPRVQRALGLPCALFIQEGEDFQQNSDATRREDAKPYLLLENSTVSLFDSSLRAKGSNPECLRGNSLDCFVAVAPRNDIIGYDSAFSRRVAPELCWIP